MNSLNGKLLKKMFASGGELIKQKYEYINELNVFPVPDGDTGSNMMITVEGANAAIEQNDGNDLFSLGKQFARGLLMNARGNSGVIFSQIFKGFIQEFKEGQKEVEVGQLIKCFENAKTAAYSSVTTPVEGTILTVIRVISEKLVERSGEIKTVESLFNMVCEEGEIILAKTTEILPELKEIGVVDSGGYGLCRFFEGMKNCLSNKGEVTEDAKEVIVKHETKVNREWSGTENNGFGYCCEFIMTIGSKVDITQDAKEDFNLTKLKNSLNKIGDSMVIVVDNEIVKVHIHSLEPYKILEIASKYGEFDKIKIENMTNQFLERNPGTRLGDINHMGQIKLQGLQNERKIVATVPSEKFVQIYNDEFKITETINSENNGNPSIQEFLTAITKCKSRNVIVVVDDSNALLAAKEAKALANQSIEIEIIPARNIATSYLCCLTFNPVGSFKENVSRMQKTCKNTSVGKISISSKNVKYSHIDIQKNDVIGIVEKKILFAGHSTLDVAKKLVDHLLKDGKLLLKRRKRDVYIFYGCDANEKDVREIEKYINETYSVKSIVINGNQPTYSFYIGIR